MEHGGGIEVALSSILRQADHGRLDLNAIDYYGFFLGEGGTNSGTIFIDDIRLE
jgi:hypothetical protein